MLKAFLDSLCSRNWSLLTLGTILALWPPEAACQSLHPNPSWPTSQEFLRVNTAIERARLAHPGVDRELVWALIWEESKYDPLAVGTKGEVGLGQLMPATAEALGVHDRKDIKESIDAAVGHIVHLYNKYDRNVRLTLAAYNSGEPRVDACKCVPAASRAYVDRIQQNRIFAQRISEYVKTSVTPLEAQSSSVSDLQEQVRQLLAKKLQSTASDQIHTLDNQLNATQAKLTRAHSELARMQKVNAQLEERLKQQDSPDDKARRMAISFSSALLELENRTASDRTGSESVAELQDLKQQIGALQIAVSEQSQMNSETRQQVAQLLAQLERTTRLYGVVAEAPRLTGTKNMKLRQPVVAIMATKASSDGKLLPDQVFSGSLQDELLRNGYGVNVELEDGRSVNQRARDLIAGRGDFIRGLKPRSGPQWDYVVVVKLLNTELRTQPGELLTCSATADSRIYDSRGILLTTRSISGTGAGFSATEALDAAEARVAKAVGDYVLLALAPRDQKEIANK